MAEQSEKGTKKGLLSEEVEAAKYTNKDTTTKHNTKHKKIRVMALIPC